MKVKSCLTLSDSMDCSLPGSSIHGIFQQEYWSGLPLPSFVSLGKFIPRYFILFVGKVNGIDSIISLSDFSLLVYRNASDFCVLILYPETAKFTD